MLYRSDAKVLAFLKKTQQDEAHFVSVNVDYCTAVHVVDGRTYSAVNSAWDNEKPLRLKMPVSSFVACLNSLSAHGLIHKPHSGTVYQVTHDGWNQREAIRRERLEFLMTHAFFPSFVSIATTVILWIAKRLLLG